MTPQQRHDCMASIHSKDTHPELVVRNELWHHGYRFRKNVRTLPGTPDIILPKYRTAIFINGCFWHGHKGCDKYTVPKSNVSFWKNKIAKNQERDLKNAQLLESIGWNVITIWECELEKSRLSETIARTEHQIKDNAFRWEKYKARRRQDRQFALDQARKRREITAALEAELQSKFHVPLKIQRLSHSEDDL